MSKRSFVIESYAGICQVIFNAIGPDKGPSIRLVKAEGKRVFELTYAMSLASYVFYLIYVAQTCPVTTLSGMRRGCFVFIYENGLVGFFEFPFHLTDRGK